MSVGDLVGRVRPVAMSSMRSAAVPMEDCSSAAVQAIIGVRMSISNDDRQQIRHELEWLLRGIIDEEHGGAWPLERLSAFDKSIAARLKITQEDVASVRENWIAERLAMDEEEEEAVRWVRRAIQPPLRLRCGRYPHCRNRFEPSKYNPRHKYCSPKCQVKASYERRAEKQKDKQKAKRERAKKRRFR